MSAMSPRQITVEMFRYCVEGRNVKVTYLWFLALFAYASWTDYTFLGILTIGMTVGMIAGRLSAMPNPNASDSSNDTLGDSSE